MSRVPLALVLAGCAPLSVPDLEVLLDVPRTCEGDEQYIASAESEPSDITNRSGQPRNVAVTINPNGDPEGVWVEGSLSADVLSDGESASLVAYAVGDCRDGRVPRPGTYPRTLEIVSTDIVGGDRVVQTAGVRVRVE
jgi:hypothetical protein